MPTSKYRRVPSYHNKQKKKYPHVEEVPVVSVKTITTMPIVVESEETETREQPKKSNKQQFRFVLLVFIITTQHCCRYCIMADAKLNYRLLSANLP